MVKFIEVLVQVNLEINTYDVFNLSLQFEN